MTHLCARFIYITWLIYYTSYAWQDSLDESCHVYTRIQRTRTCICATLLIRMQDSNMWHDSIMNVTWLNYDASHMWYDSCIHKESKKQSIHIRDMTHLNVEFKYVTWLNYDASHMWYDSCIYKESKKQSIHIRDSSKCRIQIGDVTHLNVEFK